MKRFGKRPTELAYECGLLGPRTVAAHTVHLSDAEIALFASTGTHVSHNPSSNAKLGNGVARLMDLLKAGVNVGLGHDASECNNSVSLFNVMKFTPLIHRAVQQDASLLQPGEVLRMATRNGSKALDTKAGIIAPGYKAGESSSLHSRADPAYNRADARHACSTPLTATRRLKLATRHRPAQT